MHALVIVDRDGVIQHWDAGAERAFGHRAADAIGVSLDLIVPEKYRELHWNGFRTAIQNGRPSVEPADATLPVQCADGTCLPCPGRFIFLRDQQEQVVGAAAVFTTTSST